MNTQEIYEVISHHSSEISRLHAAVHETCKHRDDSPAAHRAWIEAAEELRNRYDVLAFPGGYEGAIDRILNGDPFAMEAAICFLEIRPYFFRSGYMFKDILRKCRKAPLSPQQHKRLQHIESEVLKWRNRKARSEKAMPPSITQRIN